MVVINPITEEEITEDIVSKTVDFTETENDLEKENKTELQVDTQENNAQEISTVTAPVSKEPEGGKEDSFEIGEIFKFSCC